MSRRAMTVGIDAGQLERFEIPANFKNLLLLEVPVAGRIYRIGMSAWDEGTHTTPRGDVEKPEVIDAAEVLWMLGRAVEHCGASFGSMENLKH